MVPHPTPETPSLLGLYQPSLILPGIPESLVMAISCLWASDTRNCPLRLNTKAICH